VPFGREFEPVFDWVGFETLLWKSDDLYEKKTCSKFGKKLL
jgi:hypothetical protein